MNKLQKSALDYAVGYFRLYFHEADSTWSESEIGFVQQGWKEARNEFAQAMGITRWDAHQIIEEAYNATLSVA